MTSPGDERTWERTDPRMLLITVARSLRSAALPVAVLLLGFGRRGESTWPELLAIAGAVLAVVFGVAEWFATRYHFDGARLQVRTGVLSRTVRTVQADRVRSVELEASVLHRVLGLAKVTIGTGSDDERTTLDSLGRESSARLRQELLRRGRGAAAAATGRGHVVSPATAVHEGASASGEETSTPGGGAAGPAGQAAAGGPDAGAAEPALPERVLAVFEPSWVRFALANRGGLALVGVVGGGYAAANQVGAGDAVFRRLASWVSDQPVVPLAVGAVVAAVLIGAGLSALSYARTWWGLRLVREPGGTLHLSRGLTTTTSSTLEEARIRGVELTERLVLRALRGARLRVLTTGVGAGGTSDVLPACPREVAVAVGRQVLGRDGQDVEGGVSGASAQRAEPPSAAAADPLTVPTRRHGSAARRRLHIGAQVDTVVLWAIVGVVIAWREWSWWLLLGAVPWAVVSAALAVLAYRTLGHALTPDHLVVTDGALRRRRVVLERRGVIGWTVAQSLLQRRVGLATLTATTAAGPESLEIRDLPLPWAVALAAETTPDAVVPFLTTR